MTFARYIRQWRGINGVSVEELAERLGVLEITINKWETGKSVPMFLELRRRIEEVTGFRNWEHARPALSRQLLRFVLMNMDKMTPKQLAEASGESIESIKKCYCVLANETRRMKTMQQNICWYCKNAVPSIKTGAGCSWSRKFEPVEGWTATKTVVNESDVSYHVVGCPEFEEDEL